jgi:hypothetical protein
MRGEGAVPEHGKLLVTATAVSDWQAQRSAAAPAAHLKSICDKVWACFRLQLLDLLRALTAQMKLDVASTALLSSKLEQGSNPTCMMRLTAGFRTLNLPLALAIVARLWASLFSMSLRTGFPVGPRACLSFDQINSSRLSALRQTRTCLALAREARTRAN